MASETAEPNSASNEQLELDFPSTEEFPSYDEVDSEIGEGELPDDSFELNTADFNTEGCCVR